MMIVVLEDNDLMQQFIGDVIETLNSVEYTLYHRAETLLEDLDKGRVKPDLILVDFLLPGMSGIEAGQLIRKLLPDVPMIAITGGLFTSEPVSEIDKVHFNEMLMKPMRLEEFRQILLKYLGEQNIDKSVES